MKRVRMLLRVSSNQQLEADGDLSIQRQLVMEYIGRQDGWMLDGKEYFEGSKSGYQNTLSKRETLQEALEDARNQEYDILAVYKDDRVGRRMWEMGAFIMALKSFGVDTYTVKDGLISPEMDDIMGQMMLALRYGNAQKSSSDTGMRVKDTAQKLVQKGKFMGGSAPYGYELVLSGELSKHGRALHKLKIIPERADVVKYIYYLSAYKEYGSVRIAKRLNEDAHYRCLAPRDVWKVGKVTSILTNPVYAGYTAYKRRERIHGRYHRLDQEEWIKAEEANRDIQIIDEAMWNRVQEKRKERSTQYQRKTGNEKIHRIKKNGGILPLIDVAYCGGCGGKLVNGSRYHYWTIKDTGERRSSRTAMYRCRNAEAGICCLSTKRFPADRIEKIVFYCLGEYIAKLLKNEDVTERILEFQTGMKKRAKAELEREQEELRKLQKGIEAIERNIPAAMEGHYAFTMEELAETLRKYRKREEKQKQIIYEKREELKKIDGSWDREKILEKVPAWQQVLYGMDPDTKRILVRKLVERIEVTQEQIMIRLRWGPGEMQNHW